MNAIADTRHSVAAPHATHKLKLLLRREYWEHKGGFLWAPLLAGGVASLFATIAAVAGTVIGQKHGVHFDQDAPAEAARVAGAVGDGALMAGIGLSMAVLAFVVFFYSLGSLYDDRRDRSILFWKSMPVSDAQMVLSKAAWALVLAPLIALAIGIATGLVFWVIAVLTTSINGLPGSMGILTNSHPFRVIGNVLLALPVQMLWSLPAVGWLMLCSAWAKSKPFLWAIMIPVFAGIFVSWFDLMHAFNLESVWFWKNVVARALLSVAPASWFDAANIGPVNVEGPQAIHSVVNLGTMYSVLATPQLWLGVVAGVLMIIAAIRLRRWRDEG